MSAFASDYFWNLHLHSSHGYLSHDVTTMVLVQALFHERFFFHQLFGQLFQHNTGPFLWYSMLYSLLFFSLNEHHPFSSYFLLVYSSIDSLGISTCNITF